MLVCYILTSLPAPPHGQLGPSGMQANCISNIGCAHSVTQIDAPLWPCLSIVFHSASAYVRHHAQASHKIIWKGTTCQSGINGSFKVFYPVVTQHLNAKNDDELPMVLSRARTDWIIFSRLTRKESAPGDCFPGLPD